VASLLPFSLSGALNHEPRTNREVAMNPKKAAKPLAVLSALMSLMLVETPSKAGVVGAGSACANEGTCCKQDGSICNDGSSNEQSNKYYKSSGSCS
jgi:hypothetical protein